MPSNEDNSEFLNEKRLKKIGEVNAALLHKGAYWIHRRSENVAIMDDTAVRRTVSVDFTLPEEVEGKRFDAKIQIPQGGEPVFCPPLFLLRKASKELMAFELNSESRVRLPLMTRRDNARISGATLVGLGELIIGERLSDSLVKRLYDLATANTVRPIAAERLKQVDQDDEDHGQLSLLCESPVFDRWLWTLAHSSLVGVPYRDPTVRRKIFSLSYIESFERTLRVPTRLGWTAYKVVIESPWTGARNFHFEAEAPPGLRIVKAILGDDAEKAKSRESRRAANHQTTTQSGAQPASGRLSTGGSAGKEVSTVQAAPSSASGGLEEGQDDHDRGHKEVHADPPDERGGTERTSRERRGAESDSEGLRRVEVDHEAKGELRRVHLSRYEAAHAGADTATLDLRVSGPGFVGGALPASALVVGAMLGCLIQAHAIARFPSSAPAGLLLLPGIIATYVGRPDGHALTTRLLLFARWLLLLAALAAYGCAAVVALGETAEVGVPATQRVGELELAFWVGLALASIAFTGLGVGRLLANQRARDVLGGLVLLRWMKFAWETLRRSHFAHSMALPLSKEALRRELADHEHVLFKLGKRDRALAARATGPARPDAVEDVEAGSVEVDEAESVDGERVERGGVEDGHVALRQGLMSTWTLRLHVTETDGEVELNFHGVCLPRLLLRPMRPFLVMRESRAAWRRLKQYGEGLRQ